jgi:hypothetical protein
MQVDRSRGPTRLTQVSGSNNGGIGVNISNTSVVNVPVAGATAVTVTGLGGDYKVGGNAASAGAGAAWAVLPANTTDLAAAAPQLCRLFRS